MITNLREGSKGLDSLVPTYIRSEDVTSKQLGVYYLQSPLGMAEVELGPNVFIFFPQAEDIANPTNYCACDREDPKDNHRWVKVKCRIDYFSF